MGGQTLGKPWLTPRKSILQRGNPGPAIAVQLLPCPARKKQLKAQDWSFWQLRVAWNGPRELTFQCFEESSPGRAGCQCPGTVSETWTGDHRENRNVQSDPFSAMIPPRYPTFATMGQPQPLLLYEALGQ